MSSAAQSTPSVLSRLAVRHLYFLLLAVLMSVSGLVDAGAYQTRFERVTQAKGIKIQTYTCGLQDSQGFLWFGSEDGLLRYDGYSFREYHYNPEDPNSLSSNLVYALLEDHEGFLWVGTVGGGLNRYDPRSDHFKRYQKVHSDPNSLSHNAVISLLEDRNGYLWIGTEGGGLNRLDPTRQTFKRFQHDPQNPKSISFDSMWHLFEDRQGRIWIGTHGGGLNLLDPKSESFQHFRHDPDDEHSISSDTVGAIYEDNHDNFWIGGLNGLNRMDPETGRFTRYRHDPFNPDSIAHNHVWDIYQDDSGALWIAHFGGGISRLDLETLRFRNHHHAAGNINSLSSDLVWFVFESREQVMWVGTDGGGLNKFVRRTEAFGHISVNPNNRFSLRYSGINDVAEAADGLLWLANDGGGFQTYDCETGQAAIFRNDPLDPNTLNSDLTESILVDRNGIVWIGTYNGGLNRYDPVTGKFTQFMHHPNDRTSISDNRIWDLYEDRAGHLWVGTRNGLNLKDPHGKGFRRFVNDPQNPKSLSNNGIWSIYEDRNGTLWVGTDKGLNRYVGPDNTFEHFFSDSGNPSSLSHDTIIVMHESADGTLWIGTNGGLTRMDPNRSAFKRFGLKEGLPSNSIRGILEDDDGNLWISTLQGLSRFNIQSEQITAYTTSDGLQGNEFSKAHCRTAMGKLIFGGRNGINIFTPGKIQNNPHSPPIAFTRFSGFNREVKLGQNISTIDQIHLPYSDNMFTIEYAALDYTDPRKNRFAHKLEGFDRDWVPAGGRRSATYTNLNGGSYVFHVKGANNHGKWNNKGASIILQVDAPPWKRWWAYLLYIAVTLAIVAGLMEFRALQQKRHIAAIENINLRLNQEVEERKAFEEKLKSSEAQYRDLVENMNDVIFSTDSSGNLTFASPSMKSVLGYEPLEIIGDNFTDYIHPDDLPGILQSFSDVLAGKLAPSVYRIKAKGGDFHWIRSSSRPVYDGDNLVGLTGMFTDITEQKTLESELVQAQKMESIGTLAGGIAHDFNNILAAVIGYTELSLNEAPKGSAMRGNLKEVMQAGNRARDLVMQILAFSRQVDQESKPVKVKHITREALKFLRASLPATIEIRQNVRSDALVMADPTQLHQVIMNLCTNAAHAMQENGGMLEVTLTEVELEADAAALTPLMSRRKCLLLAIKDSGHGIPESIRDRIFDPFFTTKNEGEGTGMGLSVVHGIIGSYGGSITVASQLGRGSTFSVYLPIIETQFEPENQMDEPIAAGSGRILFVDDEAALASIGQKSLEALGYQVTTCTSSLEALRLFEAGPDQFDLVITDLTMPNMTGDQLAEAVTHIRPEIPVIMCTGYSARIQEDRIAAAGIRALISKPVLIRELSDVIKAVLPENK